MKHLLIVYHSKTGNTARLIDAACSGASRPEVSDVVTKRLTAAAAGPRDVLWADGIILGSPENFGYMAGALKDFFDRTFYEVEGKINPLPMAVIISAGNDGQNALRQILRITKGYPFVEVQPAIVAQGAITSADLAQCQDLGLAMAVGLEAGIW